MLEKRLTEVTMSSLPVVGGGTALGLAMRGGGGGGGASGRGVLVGSIGDGAGPYTSCQGQATCGVSLTALL